MIGFILVLGQAWAWSAGEADFAWLEAPRALTFQVALPGSWEEAELSAALARVERRVNTSGASITVVLEPGLAPLDPNDGVNAIGWAGSDGVALRAEEARAVSCDVSLDENQAWSSAEAGAAAGEHDLERALGRGLLGCLGLGATEAPDSLLFGELGEGTSPEARALGADDRAGLIAIYGAANLQVAANSHGIFYDVQPPNDGECCAGPGEAVGLQVGVEYQGDVPLFGAQIALSGLTGPDNYLLLDAGPTVAEDLHPGDTRTLRYLFAVEEACEGLRTVAFTLAVTHEGEAEAPPVVFESFVQCGGEGVPEEEEEEKRCGCASGRPGVAWLALLFASALVRRRR